MFEFIKQKKLIFEKELSIYSKPKIKPLLSKDVEQPENLQFDRIKYEFYKPFVTPVQIKSEYQNAEEVKTDFVSEK